MILNQTRGKYSIILKQTREKSVTICSRQNHIHAQLQLIAPNIEKAYCLYYEPDYLKHAREIIFQFLAEKKSDIYKGRLTNRFCYWKRFFVNFSLRPPLFSQPTVDKKFEKWDLKSVGPPHPL